MKQLHSTIGNCEVCCAGPVAVIKNDGRLETWPVGHQVCAQCAPSLFQSFQRVTEDYSLMRELADPMSESQLRADHDDHEFNSQYDGNAELAARETAGLADNGDYSQISDPRPPVCPKCHQSFRGPYEGADGYNLEAENWTWNENVEAWFHQSCAPSDRSLR
jgi:hypothetical protein